MSILNSKASLIIGFVLGSLITILAIAFLRNFTLGEIGSEATGEKTPLYWVAPMDSNYKRDKPGLSPMGMALVPVYEESSSPLDGSAKLVVIAPEVVNHLGVRTAKTEMLELDSEIKTVGYVQYDEDQLLHIHPRVEGWVEKLYLKAEGDPVVKGQPLYEIYSPALVNAQEELLLALERKNTRLIKAAEDRLTALQLPKTVIQQLVSDRQVRQTVTFYAPQHGVVDNLNIRQGFYVKPGTTLMSIGSLAQVWVEAEIFERQAFQVAVGIPVTMSLDYIPGREWLGKVDYVYPTLNAKNRTVKVRLRFENPESILKPNMFAQVIIHARSHQKVLVVPKEAVIRTGNQDRVVLALGEGRFKSKVVKIGQQDQVYREILEGLELDDTIVTSAQFLIDSESNKSIDFKRMERPEPQYPTANVSGKINRVDHHSRIVNISRESIPKWQRGVATLDFSVDASVNINKMSEGDVIGFRFEVRKHDFVLVEILSDADSKANGEE